MTPAYPDRKTAVMFGPAFERLEKCKTCDELIASHARTSRFYVAIAKMLLSAPDNEFTAGIDQAEALRQACHDLENELYAHWQAHI